VSTLGRSGLHRPGAGRRSHRTTRGPGGPLSGESRRGESKLIGSDGEEGLGVAAGKDGAAMIVPVALAVEGDDGAKGERGENGTGHHLAVNCWISLMGNLNSWQARGQEEWR
jgi:hypothetical protein